jgi:hypothetical protein
MARQLHAVARQLHGGLHAWFRQQWRELSTLVDGGDCGQRVLTDRFPIWQHDVREEGFLEGLDLGFDGFQFGLDAE